ncbi:aldo/keto reductase [Mameliella sediminis]|uniref:aldo/keto reductase n=1 Tax=Mameliella sediminis TaxID=2836866 RepID=UPI001C4722FF|nr:aldo/keto reductase [Mameliella sediminis]MBV7396035.1 aldo/keto reductase [Mameliella sediminis]
MARYALGKTDLDVTELCFGASALGDMPDTYGYSVDDDRAFATINAIFDGPVNFLDTSRNYGFGRSEERIGQVIKARGGLPDGFVLSTKLDRDMETGRFDATRVRESIEESLTALNLDTIPLLHLHDPEHARDLQEITGEGGALDELFKLKEEGLAQAVGLAMGRLDIMEPILRAYPFDALISHNRFTLLNRAADGMFDYAYDNEIAVLNAAPFASGVLAKGSAQMPRITYQEADDAALAPVRAIEEVCARHGVPTGPAALQFSLRDPRITSTIVGVSKPERVQQTLDWAAMKLPEALWDDLSALPFSDEDPEANRAYKPG